MPFLQSARALAALASARPSSSRQGLRLCALPPRLAQASHRRSHRPKVHRNVRATGAPPLGCRAYHRLVLALSPTDDPLRSPRRYPHRLHHSRRRARHHPLLPAVVLLGTLSHPPTEATHSPLLSFANAPRAAPSRLLCRWPLGGSREGGATAASWTARGMGAAPGTGFGGFFHDFNFSLICFSVSINAKKTAPTPTIRNPSNSDTSCVPNICCNGGK